MIISLKVDVTKLDKSRFFKGKQKPDGSTPVYADMILNLKDDQSPDAYGNCGFISQSSTQEERRAGKKMPILGNAKMVGGRTVPRPAQSDSIPDDGDLAF